MTEHVKVAVVGIGGMGHSHARHVVNGQRTKLVAIYDIDHSRADEIAAEFNTTAYTDYHEMLSQVEAVIIATPHYSHPALSIEAMQRGIHVLVEKPIAVHAKVAQRMIDSYETARAEYPQLVFGAMFNQRTYGFWRKIKAMIDDGELGRLIRTTWIITNWYRTQAYYDSGGWRATWKGEGGGVLLNQCPHNLDLYQWFVGMPQRVIGHASLGKYHRIEVEDEVTGYMEYANGMVGHFITSTAESPGTNRLEIVGENGKLLFENGQLTFFRNQMSMFEHLNTSPERFAHVAHEVIDVEYDHHGEGGHRQIIENFADAILDGTELIAPAVEGIHSVALGNAILMSALQQRPIELPLDGDIFENLLHELMKQSEKQMDGAL